MQDDNNQSNMGPLARHAGKGALNAGKDTAKGAGKAGKGVAKGTYHTAKAGTKGITKLAAFFSVNIGWFIGAFFIGVLILLMLIFGIIISSDSPSCGGSGDGGTYSADFKIKDVGNGGDVSVPIEKWCASQHLNAAQTAGILGNSEAESTLGTAHNGGGKYGDFMGAGATTADTSHNDDSVPAYMNWFVNKFGNDGGAPGTYKKYKSMKSSSPYSCGYWWGVHIEADGAGNNSTRGQYAQKFYKEISGGNSTVTTADDTSDSGGSGDSCGSSGDDSDNSDVIAFGKKYLGLSYDQGTRFQSIKDIVAGKPKSETADNDCDGFVYAVLKHCGYDVPSSYWGDVEGMEQTYKSKKISLSDTHEGTPAVYPEEAPDGGRLGHAFFLMSKWHGKDTEILGEGPSDVCIKPAWWVLTGGDLNDIQPYNVGKK